MSHHLESIRSCKQRTVEKITSMIEEEKVKGLKMCSLVLS